MDPAHQPVKDAWEAPHRPIPLKFGSVHAPRPSIERPEVVAGLGGPTSKRNSCCGVGRPPVGVPREPTPTEARAASKPRRPTLGAKSRPEGRVRGALGVF